ncbi:MAG TPA: D-arabinono-1,4-lactone oxidase [Blastocatellia bacterium]|nr:D-arabinono-1,4-lactone oxidase [Blastocatellia bacterium]
MSFLAKIAESLFHLKADPDNTSLIEKVHDQIDTHGIDFYRAVVEHLAIPVSELESTAPRPQAAEAAGGGLQRHTWKNFSGTQTAQPLRYFKPSSLDELAAIVGRAAAEKCEVRAIGSGHSHSDVAVTSGFMVDTHGLNRVLDLETALLKSPAEEATLFRVECGITIRDLNAALDAAGKALINMGGYDAQTIIGASSTSTHGSGIDLGPLSSSIVSVVLVAGDGRIYQIEPADGITDPARFKAEHPEIELKQDDDWFRSVAVSLGCLGVIYSVTLRVMKKYWLTETRVVSDWDAVRELLRDGTVLHENRHFEVLINPYEVNGQRTCLITRRDFASPPTEPLVFRPHRQMFADLLATLPGTREALLFLFDEFPHLTPKIIDSAVRQLKDANYVNVSYEIFNIGGANQINAYSAEIAFPLTTYIAAVDRMLEIADQTRRLGNLYHTSPFALRFVKASDSYMSMQFGRDTCMVEIPMITGTIGGKEILQRYETAMYAFGGRPHWGQINYLTGSHGLIEAMYPKLGAWLSVFKELNANGMFNSVFTERCGFSESRFS